MYTVVIISLFGLIAAYGQLDNQEPSIAPSVASLDDVGTPSMWISDLLHQGLANFSIRNIGSTACRRQTEMYEQNLRNYTSWAVKMAESWERHPIGILAGKKYHLGVYDECVDVHFPVRGQYCIPEIKIVTKTGKDYKFNRTDNLYDLGVNHAWKTILGWTNYTDRVHRNIMNIGVCIPDSCSANDLQTSLQNELDNMLFSEQVKVFVKVDPITCTTSEDKYPYETGYYVTTSLLLIIILVCCGATLHHFITLSYYKTDKDAHVESHPVFYSFSFIASSKELLKYDKTNDLNFVHGFKVLVMILILFGHKCMFYIGNPVSHSKYIEDVVYNGPTFLRTSLNLVDPFFYITGYLTYVMVNPTFSKPGSGLKNVIFPIIYRVVRIFPAYLMIMAVTVYILPHIGDGPFWPQKTWHEAENCKNYWWTNVLFISNFISAKNQCLLISWHLACDMQFFVVGLIVLYVYSKNKKFGIGLLSVLLCLSFCIPFIVTLMTKLDSILKVDLPFLENPRSSPTFNESYRLSYMRAIPFFVGLAVGFLNVELTNRNVKFSQITVFAVTFIVIVVSLYIQFYCVIFYQEDRPYYPIEQALYAPLYHCTLTGIAVVINIFQHTNGYGLLMKTLDNRFIVPLGRLSYAVFLVNLIVMLISQSTQRLPNYGSFEYLMNAVIQDICKTYLMAILLYLFVEAPFGNLTRLLSGRGPKKFLAGESNRIPTESTTIGLESQNKEISHL